ncbi:neural-cadherin [Trichonephila clavipes]|nr:neural-cadherin [Trichonephila clavipes]
MHDTLHFYAFKYASRISGVTENIWPPYKVRFWIPKLDFTKGRYLTAVRLWGRSSLVFKISDRGWLVTSSSPVPLKTSLFGRVTKYIRIGIGDKNDNPPYFDQSLYEAEVNEDEDIQHTVITVTAKDKDEYYLSQSCRIERPLRKTQSRRMERAKTPSIIGMRTEDFNGVCGRGMAHKSRDNFLTSHSNVRNTSDFILPGHELLSSNEFLFRKSS